MALPEGYGVGNPGGELPFERRDLDSAAFYRRGLARRGSRLDPRPESGTGVQGWSGLALPETRPPDAAGGECADAVSIAAVRAPSGALADRRDPAREQR